MDISRLLQICLITFTFLIKSGLSSNEIFKQCDPAEEGLKHSLRFSWNVFNLSMSVFIFNHHSIASCTLNLKCTDLMINKTTTELYADHLSNRVTLTVKILNVSRSDVLVSDGDWEIKDKTNATVLLTCKLNVFFRVQAISCSYKILDDNLSITCSTPKVYPQAKCRFLTNITQTISLPNDSINYKSTTLQENPVYFSSYCTAAVPTSVLRHGYFYFNVTMYPDVTNNDNDISYGLNKTVYIFLESPSVALKDCPKLNTSNYHGTCTCERNDSNSTNATIHWYDTNGNIIQNEESHILSFYMSTVATAFYCQANNILGWKSNNATFSPFTLSPPQLTDTFENSTSLLLNFGSVHIISIILNISGYPKPQNYRIVKNGLDKIDFTNVTNGNAQANVFRIQYIDDVNPYGTLNLTFSILKEEDFTNYLFVVDNGVSPPLKYDILIERENQNDETEFTKIVASLVSVVVCVAFIIFGGKFLASRMKANKNHQIMHEELLYEDIESYDIDHNTHGAINDVPMRCTNRANAGSSLYDTIDESLVVEDNRSVRVCNTETLTKNKYDVLYNEPPEENNTYDKLPPKLVPWNNDYITIIGDTDLDENEYIIVFNEESKDATGPNSLLGKSIQDYPEYNTTKETVYSLNTV